MDWAIDWRAFWLLVALIFCLGLAYRLIPKRPDPHLLFPNLQILKETGVGWRQRFGKLPNFLLYLSLGAFAVAFINPSLLIPRQGDQAAPPERAPVEGIAIYFILDVSGSMADAVDTYNKEGSRIKIPKIDLLKQVTTEFIKGLPNDMIGLVTLARGAQVLSPLTLDHQAILNLIAKLKPFTDPAQGGTVIGYAIFKTANLIAATRHFAEELIEEKQPAYMIKSAIMILVTDGFQDPNPLDENKPLRMMDVPEGAAYARKEGVKLYIINVQPDMAKEQYAAVRHQMEHAAESTGGKYYLMQGTTSLAQIYAEIDKLEKGAIPAEGQQPNRYQNFYLFPYLVGAGLTALFLSLLLRSTLLRRVP